MPGEYLYDFVLKAPELDTRLGRELINEALWFKAFSAERRHELAQTVTEHNRYRKWPSSCGASMTPLLRESTDIVSYRQSVFAWCLMPRVAAQPTAERSRKPRHENRSNVWL
jgi:hypothetical protein